MLKLRLGYKFLFAAFLLATQNSFGMDGSTQISFSPFNHNPELIRQEKEKYDFQPIAWNEVLKLEETARFPGSLTKILTVQPEMETVLYTNQAYKPIQWAKTSEIAKKIFVPMGAIKWIETNSESYLFTDNILDCVAVVFISNSQLGLAHISPKNYDLLNSEISNINNPEDYTIYLISNYYSNNLEGVHSILKAKFSKIHGDISDNFMAYDPSNPWDSWESNHKFFYSDSRNMQAQNMNSRMVSVHAKTGYIHASQQ